MQLSVINRGAGAPAASVSLPDRTGSLFRAPLGRTDNDLCPCTHRDALGGCSCTGGDPSAERKFVYLKILLDLQYSEYFDGGDNYLQPRTVSARVPNIQLGAYCRRSIPRCGTGKPMWYAPTLAVIC